MKRVEMRDCCEKGFRESLWRAVCSGAPALKSRESSFHRAAGGAQGWLWKEQMWWTPPGKSGGQGSG